jgi:2-keto-3-deoxy-L-rhamnonate aldolase RhmA
LEQIDAIAATPGVDVIFVGTSDLAFSLGHRGQQDHPEVQEALKKIVAAGRAHHKILGAPATDSAQLRKLIEQGFLFFQTATELVLMARAARQLLEPFGKAAAEPKTSTLY